MSSETSKSSSASLLTKSKKDETKEEQDREMKSSEDERVDTLTLTEAGLSTEDTRDMNKDKDKEIGIRSKLDVEEPAIATYQEGGDSLQDAGQELPPIDEDEIVLEYENWLQDEIFRDEQPVQEEPIVKERRKDVFWNDKSKLDVEEPIIATYLEGKSTLQDALQELPQIDEDAIVLAYESRLQDEIIRDEQPVQEEPIVAERREDVFQNETRIQELLKLLTEAN
ncbi:hypothetical protein ACROYT_G018232 [Oculina patagonica]